MWALSTTRKTTKRDKRWITVGVENSSSPKVRRHLHTNMSSFLPKLHFNENRNITSAFNFEIAGFSADNDKLIKNIHTNRRSCLYKFLRSCFLKRFDFDMKPVLYKKCILFWILSSCQISIILYTLAYSVH